MKLNQLLIVALSITMIFASALPTMAQNPGKRPCGPPPMDLTRLVEGLNLSATQKEPVEAILARYHDEQKGLLAKLRDARKQLSSVIFAKEFNEDAVRKAFQQKSSIKENLVVTKAKMIAQLRKVLDPEQIGYLRGRMHGPGHYRGIRPVEPVVP